MDIADTATTAEWTDGKQNRHINMKPPALSNCSSDIKN